MSAALTSRTVTTMAARPPIRCEMPLKCSLSLTTERLLGCLVQGDGDGTQSWIVQDLRTEGLADEAEGKHGPAAADTRRHQRVGRIDGHLNTCLLYTSDAADDLLCVDLGGRRII